MIVLDSEGNFPKHLKTPANYLFTRKVVKQAEFQQQKIAISYQKEAGEHLSGDLV